jgi:hypothetical protein
MVIDQYVLNAADHARRTGETRVFGLFSLGGGLMIRPSVLTTKSFMRSPSCEFTANK